jgi:hypothetical protein
VSVGSIVPEQTAHLPLVCVRDCYALGIFLGESGGQVKHVIPSV